VLGIAAALALTHNHASAGTLPLATSQRLWDWDIHRLVQDGSGLPVNMIGFNMRGDEGVHAEAVQSMNARPVRQYDIRNLASLFVIGADEPLKTACRAALEAFPKNLPFEFESQKKNKACIDHLRRNAEIWLEFGKKENYAAVPAKDGSGSFIILQNPRSEDADVVESARRWKEMNDHCGLQLWADDCFKSGKISDRLSLVEALSRARALDKPDLFQNRKPPGTDNNILLGAVAGTAAAALSFGGTLNDVDLTWAKAVIERASETPEIDDGLWFARSNDPHHPCNYAVRGFAALIRRGIDVGVAKRRLLELASHPLDQVSEEAIGAALGLWQDDANFAFVALDLGLKFSTGLRHTIRSAYGYEPSGDRERRASAVGEALQRLKEKDPLVTLTRLPPAWVAVSEEELGAVGDRRLRSIPAWRKPDELWRWDYAPRILRRIPIERVIADDLRREPFLAMCADMLNWTIERLAPSWETDDRGRRDRQSGDLLEWRRSLFSFLGAVASCIDADEARRRFLESIFGLEDELCLSLLEPFVNSYICSAILDPPQIQVGAIELLDGCAEPMLRDKALASASYRDGHIYGHYLPDLIRSLFFIRYEAGGAARFANGDWTEVQAILPIITRMMRVAGAIPHVMRSFLTLCERALEHYPSDKFIEEMLGVLKERATTPPGWRGEFIASRIAAHSHCRILSRRTCYSCWICS
jgi:hypothetical protein